MGCLVVLLAFISPRLALFAIFVFSDLLSRAFDSWFVPFLVLSKRQIRIAYPAEQ
jgi:hypothetical protein